MEQLGSPPRNWWEWIRCFFPRSGHGSHPRSQEAAAELHSVAGAPSQQDEGMRAGSARSKRSPPDSLLRRSPRLRRPVIDPGTLADPDIHNVETQRSTLRKDSERRRPRGAEQLYIDPALIWSFVREAHGWGFVDDSSWMVSAPSTPSNARPIQLTQVRISVYAIFRAFDRLALSKTVKLDTWSRPKSLQGWGVRRGRGASAVTQSKLKVRSPKGAPTWHDRGRQLSMPAHPRISHKDVLNSMSRGSCGE